MDYIHTCVLHNTWEFATVFVEAFLQPQTGFVLDNSWIKLARLACICLLWDMVWFLQFLHARRHQAVAEFPDFDSIRLDLVDNVSVDLSVDYPFDGKGLASVLLDDAKPPEMSPTSSGALCDQDIQDAHGAPESPFVLAPNDMEPDVLQPDGNDGTQELSSKENEQTSLASSHDDCVDGCDQFSAELSPFVSNTEKVSFFTKMKLYFNMRYPPGNYDLESLLSSNLENPITIDEIIRSHNNKIDKKVSTNSLPLLATKESKIKFTTNNDVYVYSKDSGTELTLPPKWVSSPSVFGLSVPVKSIKRKLTVGCLKPNFTVRKTTNFHSLLLQPNHNLNNTSGTLPAHSILKNKRNSNFETENLNTSKLDSVNYEHFMKMFEQGETQKLHNEQNISNLRLQQLKTYYQNIDST